MSIKLLDIAREKNDEVPHEYEPESRLPAM
jgi:hypothetical protein